MPASINTDIGIHYAAFGAVKLAGYSAYAYYLNKKYEMELNPLLVGSTRTLLGIIFGVPAGLLLTGPIFFITLIFLRIIEWFATIWLFYDR